jgi:hypothetical protein
LFYCFIKLFEFIYYSSLILAWKSLKVTSVMRFFLTLVSFLPFCGLAAVSGMEADCKKAERIGTVNLFTGGLSVTPMPPDFVPPSISELTGLRQMKMLCEDPIQKLANIMEKNYNIVKDMLEGILITPTTKPTPANPPSDSQAATATPATPSTGTQDGLASSKDPPLNYQYAVAVSFEKAGLYGDSKGISYFQLFSDVIVLPALCWYFKHIHPENFDRNSLQILLRFLGNLRFLIAFKTGSIDYQNFGYLMGDFHPPSFGPLLIQDPIHGFKNWYKYFTEEVLGKKFAYLLDKPVSAFIQEPGAFTSPYCQYVKSHYSEIKRLLFEKYKKHRYTLDATNARVFGDPELHMIVHPLIPAYVPNFTVCHAAYSPTYYKELLPIFLEAVKNPTLENTARVYYFINVRSFYLRGQAAITLWLLKALLASGGKKLLLDDEIVKTGVNLVI